MLRIGFAVAALSPLWLVGIAHAQFATRKAEKAPSVDEMRSNPAYTDYARILVQLELLSNAATARLPIVVSTNQTGQLQVGGRVDSPRVRQHVIAMARRISGLKIVDEMQSGDVARDAATLPKQQLESLTTESIQALFPEIAGRVRVTVKEDGIVTLNGSSPSYEQKLKLSEFVKGQPGCKAVQNLLTVDVDAGTGEVAVNEGGSARLKAAKLPSVPPAPIADLSSPEERLSVRQLTASKAMADDAPSGEIADRQLREEVRHQLDANPEMANVDVQIETADATVTLSGQFKNRAMVEKLVDTASNSVGARKIVAKCTPYSIQRSLAAPKSAKDKATPAKQPTKLLGFIPWGGGEGKAEAAGNTRGFREGVRKALKKRCEGRFEKITVNNTIRGLVIEGDVATARDRTFVLKQIDNMVELRGINYDVVLRMKDAK